MYEVPVKKSDVRLMTNPGVVMGSSDSSAVSCTVMSPETSRSTYRKLPRKYS